MNPNQDLINEAEEFVKYGSDLNPVEADRLISELCDALAAPVPVDEAKLAEVVDSHKMTIYGVHDFAGCAVCGERYVDTGIGILRWFSQHRAHAVAEWLGGGER